MSTSASTDGAPQFVKVTMQPKGVAIVTIQRSDTREGKSICAIADALVGAFD